MRIFEIVAERCATPEAAFGVKPASRFKILHGTCFQVQPAITSFPGFRDDVLKNPRCNTLSQVLARGPHRFDLAMVGIQFLKRPAPCQFSSVPRTPEGYVTLAQPAQVQCMPAFGRRNVHQGREMFGQQPGDGHSTQIIDADIYCTHKPGRFFSGNRDKVYNSIAQVQFHVDDVQPAAEFKTDTVEASDFLKMKFRVHRDAGGLFFVNSGNNDTVPQAAAARN
jgi:hypothetical protein